MSGDTKDVARQGTALIATLASLVFGLLIASANGKFETESGQIKQLTASVVLLDNALGLYGPEAKPARAQLRPPGWRGGKHQPVCGRQCKDDYHPLYLRIFSFAAAAIFLIPGAWPAVRGIDADLGRAAAARIIRLAKVSRNTETSNGASIQASAPATGALLTCVN